MSDSPAVNRRVLMLGTFGMRPKATMRSRALGMARALRERGWDAAIITVPWDNSSDAGRCWSEHGIPIHNTKSTQPFRWPLAVSEIVRYARDYKPELIHVFKPKGFGDLAARRLGRDYPIVVDMDDWEGNRGWNNTGLYGPVERRLFDWQERTLPARAGAVTIASRILRDRAIDGGTAPRRIFYLPNALTTDRWRALAPSASSSSGKTMLLYTRFVEFDPRWIAHILATVRESVPEARLVIAGGSSDGSAEILLKEAANHLGVDQAIEWIGWIDPAQLRELAARCRLAIHPFDDTLLNRAKCSVKLLELMACRLPVVTTSVGENASFIDHGVSGVLVQPGDTEAFAKAVVDLLDNDDRCRQIGLAARERVEQQHLWQNRVDPLLAAYRYALAVH